MNTLRLLRSGLLVAAAVILFGSCGKKQSLPDVVSYNFHIRPILSDRCFKCHGPDARQRKADLRLDVPEGALAALKKNPGAHAIVPGKPEDSELFARISSADTSVVMPPPGSNLTLTADEIALIRKWIEQGAEYQRHWALIPPVLPAVPAADDDWARNEIDRFVWARMDEKGLSPNEPADRERLLKRVWLDMTGLPPPVDVQEAFLKDESPDAYEKQVDALLGKPQYGERMAIAWLDVARYADSHGYQDDGLRTMWPWRDWVIHAFNQNYPYNQFILWQLAGDQLPNPTKEMLLATGFNRNHKITQEGGVIDEEYRIEYVTDRTNTFGKAFLGLTYECAKCHDHKYDPISQRDYFRTFAFFNQVAEKGYQGDIFSGFPADPPRISITPKEAKEILTFVNLRDTVPVQVMVMHDSSWHRPTHVLRRGAYDAPGEVVEASAPASIMPFDTTRFSGNRLGLARWLVDDQHPLTARVFVNRVWQEFFGRGIVKTSGDFGQQGELPSHPELLDWLAVDFRTHGWDIKRLVKQLVMSATYQQSATISEKQRSIDPENIYLSHAPRMRLPAELVRDLALSTSGLLNTEIGGPSVKPYQPDGIWEIATSGRGVLATYVQDHGDKLYRRGMYTFIKRTVPPPVSLVFDGSNRDQCEVRRLRTNTPLQALVMMNDPTVMEASRVLAEQLSAGNTPAEETIAAVFRRILCRKIRPEESRVLIQYYEKEKARLQKSPEAARKLLNTGEYKHAVIRDLTATAAMMEVIMTIYNLEEAITKT
ncbi:MAG: PSD1 and planctomycete cytochrome C domain-containing protein [Cyclobacteriaceae bacterium]|nr:PSD1 and planctomycete cytochrome C domain-containing protein [Cyclobacteriaceae bacterium]